MSAEDGELQLKVTKSALLKREEVLEVIDTLFLQEHITLRAHPKNEQNIIGSKLVVVEIELKRLIKELVVVENKLK